MSDSKVLVIDDSTTTRQLCSKVLGAAGFEVLTAITAKEGLEMVSAERPDIILLDHQLTETTGYEVACELLANPELASIPIVVSSSQRTDAYQSYINCSNVVDVLPKPYTSETLVAKIENAIKHTAYVPEQSQDVESSVPEASCAPEASSDPEVSVPEVSDPEVIEESGESDLTGTFACFGLREIIDMLNNSRSKGMLTVECENSHVSVYLDQGRIQGATASGIEPETVSNQMPSALAELASVIKLTLGDQNGKEVEGLMGLLDNNVIDSRLVKKLLRLQAAILLRACFTKPIVQFRFDRDVAAPHLFQKLPLDSSLVAILIESALICHKDELPTFDVSEGFVRKEIRGQSLDSAGVSGRHVKFMSAVSEPVNTSEVSQQLRWSEEEVIRVAHGFEMADLIECVTLCDKPEVTDVTTSGEQTMLNGDDVIQCNYESVDEESTQKVEG